MDSRHGKLGVRFFQNLPSSVQRLCPISLVVCYHERNTTLCPTGNVGRRSASALHSCSLSSDLHEMSLIIDMIIRPAKLSGVSPKLSKNSWTWYQSCSVVTPGKRFHSNSIGSQSTVSQGLYCDELLHHVNFVFPNNIWLWILAHLPKAQHRF